ncbi:PRC-barrel domain-containing protein [Pararhodonellum marinum]|uniref:PRC-barrel domain-containing protein n=1 Tax=Pararhodonellum marinum TaxID=2755358 RepID=UPI00188F6C8D|nr:PRC-barrel domain-containing protein [Pararhodonellum marinum]
MKTRDHDSIVSASTIEGNTVRTLADEKIGSIKDVMLDAESGKVAYVVLSVDTGFLNLSSKYFAIPWSAFSFHTEIDDVFILDVDRERLENSPGFDKDNWPSGPQRDFVNEVNTYYGIEEDFGISERESSGMHRSQSSDMDRGHRKDLL